MPPKATTKTKNWGQADRDLLVDLTNRQLIDITADDYAADDYAAAADDDDDDDNDDASMPPKVKPLLTKPTKKDIAAAAAKPPPPAAAAAATSFSVDAKTPSRPITTRSISRQRNDAEECVPGACGRGRPLGLICSCNLLDVF